jgi:hypothetical protein
MAIKSYKVLARCYINERLYEIDDVVTVDDSNYPKGESFIPGEHLKEIKSGKNVDPEA